MSDLISRQAVLALPRDYIRNMKGEIVEESIDVANIKALPSAEPKTTLLHATKIVLEFIESCNGTTAWLITPDGDRLSCDWGYVEEGMRELIRYAERREE